MAGATNQGTATAAITGAGGAAAGVCAAAVCGYCHLRCAPGICLILQCKITKVVERPGVHYRGRHSPWISSDRCGCCRFFSVFCSTPARIQNKKTVEPRGGSLNSRFGFFLFSKRRRKRKDSVRRKHRFHLLLLLLCAISSPFYHWLITLQLFILGICFAVG